MTEISERYTRVAEGFNRRLVGCEGHWTDPTPCEEWSVWDVAAHVVGVNRGVLCRLEGGEPEKLEKGDELPQAFEEVSSNISAVLVDLERAGTIVTTRTGEQPFEQLAGTLLCADTLAHTWDIARATGQDERLDVPAIQAVQPFLEGLSDAMRSPGGFGPKVEPPEGADVQTAYLCFTGRKP